MFEAMTAEALVSLALVGASLLAIGGAMASLRATRPVPVTTGGDLDAAVRSAPYGRLHNIVPQGRG